MGKSSERLCNLEATRDSKDRLHSRLMALCVPSLHLYSGATRAVCYRVHQSQVTASWVGAETHEPLEYQMCDKKDVGINK